VLCLLLPACDVEARSDNVGGLTTLDEVLLDRDLEVPVRAVDVVGSETEPTGNVLR